MKHKLQLGAGLATLSALAVLQTAQGALIHRYSFGEASGSTTVKDSVGTADGTVKGNGSAFDGAGKLSLFGGGSSAATADAIAGYVDLPNHMFNVLTNVTFETWVTWDENPGSWPRVFDFGTSAGGEDISDGNGTYLFLSPRGADNIRFAVRELTSGTEYCQATAAAPLEVGTEVCLTVTYDTINNVARVYSNAVMIAKSVAPTPLNTINDVNNWLGRSQWGDSMFTGTFNEFRVYDNALNAIEVAASYASGPNNPSTDPSALGALETLNLIIPKTELTEQDTQNATATADYAGAKGLPLAGIAGVTFESDKPAVLTISAKGEMVASSPGSAKVTLSYGGKSTSVTITVKARVLGMATAGELYVDLRASDLKSATDTSIWPNRAGKGDFTGTGEATYVANVENSGVAGIQFATATSPYAGPMTTADLTGNSDCSIEVWVYNPAVADEETLVAFGKRGGPDASNMSFNYGGNTTWGAVGHWGAPDMGWNGVPKAGQWHYLVYTYDGVDTGRVYADGALKYSETFTGGLSIHPDQVIRVAAQSTAAGDQEPTLTLTGYIAMVRVHGGQLSDLDIAGNYLFGPTLTDPGALQDVALAFDDETLLGARDFAQATVKANYANLKDLGVTAFSTYSSSDPTVATVDAAGKVVALKEGSTTITAEYKGKSATKAITVVSAPGLALKHRYSFSEAAGSTTTKDYVGTADGAIKGNGADFDGAGVLTLNGGTASSAAADTISGYVDLPNGIISSLKNISLESWITWDGSGTWQRVYDLGTSAGGEDISDGNGGYLFLSPQGDTNLRFAVRDPAVGNEPTQLTSTAPLATGTEIYIAVSYDYTANVAKLYSNAVEVATGPAAVNLKTINDVNNWLGRSQWGDNMFAGKFNEFRIWEGALSAEQVAANFAAGPNTVPDVTPAKVSLGVAATGTAIKISWPTTATGFGLESSPVVGAGATWTAVDVSGAVEQSGQKVLTITPQDAAKYFRLKK